VAVAAADRRKLALDGDVMVVGQGSARGCASGRDRGLSAPSFPSSCFSICDVATVAKRGASLFSCYRWVVGQAAMSREIRSSATSNAGDNTLEPFGSPLSSFFHLFSLS